MAFSANYTRRTPEQSVFYKAFKKQWPIIRAMCRAANDGHGLPDFIEKGADNFLRCGMLEHGFIYAKCDRCQECAAVAFSCKQRGLCNSCDTKRGVEISAHLVDDVIPRVKIRQWVITFPFDLRYLLAWHKKLRAQILSAVMRGLERHYLTQARAQGGQDPKYAAVSVAQRMDGAVRLNVHIHILCGDGAWVKTDNGVEFLQAPPLQQHIVEEVLADVLKRIGRQTAKLPDLIEDPGLFPKPDNSAMASILKSAMLGNQLQGKHKGEQQRVEFGKHAPTIHSDLRKRNCARAAGFSLHADRTVAPDDREDLEGLCNYLCRPAFAASRLEELKDGTIRMSLKSVWKGGIVAVFLSAYELVIRVLAQMSLPFCPTVHYHGCFAGNSKLRAKVVLAGDKPKARRKKSATEKDQGTRLTWAAAFKRAHKIDVLSCPCGGKRRVIAAVRNPKEVERFLRHLHLWPGSGDINCVRGPPELFDFDEQQRQSDWDDVYEMEAQMKADEQNWAA